MLSLKVQFLGGFRVFLSGQEVSDVFSERVRLLLAFLLLNSGSSISRKQLAYTFWPETTESQARTNLRNLLHRFRNSIQEADTFFQFNNQTIRRRSKALITLDVEDFSAAISIAETCQDDQERITYFQQAADLYRGELLPGLYEDWLLRWREELNQQYLKALFDLSALLEDKREYKEAIQVLDQLIRNDPLNETAYQHSMRLHALNNDRTGALKVYHACSTVLMQELEVEPLPETQVYYKQILRLEDAITEDPIKKQAPDIKTIIGREQEWQALRKAWQTASRGKPGAVSILGEAGIGKSRLANELVQWARRQGIYSAFAQCYSGEGELPYAPVIDWLRTPEFNKAIEDLDDLWRNEIARLLPEYQHPEEAGSTSSDMDQKWQRRRLFEALAKGLLGHGRPLLLILDDAQWSDQDSLDFIHYLLHYDKNAPLLIVLTARTEDLTSSNPVSQLGVKLQSKGQLQEIELTSLTKEEVQELVTDRTSKNVQEELLDRLYAESEGNPLFIVEMLRSGEDSISDSLPISIRALLVYRLEQLSPTASELVGLASAIGREFSYHLLEASCQMDEDSMVQALDELWLRRIILNQQGDTYNFSHGKLRDTAYDLLSGARRRLYHRRIAETLISIYSGDEELGYGLTAKHFELAGRYNQAVEQYILAASTSRRVFANAKAVQYLEQAHALIGNVEGNSEQIKKSIEIRESLGDIYEVIGRRGDALDVYSKVLELLGEEDNLTKARVLGKIAKITAAMFGYGNVDENFRKALEALGDPPDQTNTAWWHIWLDIHFERVWMYYNLADYEKMESTLDSLFPIIERLNALDKLVAYKFNLVGVHLRRNRFRLDESTRQLSWETLTHCKELNNSEYLIRATNGYGLISLWSGDLENAQRYLEEGLSLAEQAGEVINKIISLTYLAVTYRLRNNPEVCQDYAEQALSLSEREEESTYAAAAKANLGWVAWRNKQINQAEKMCLSALEEWSAYYPFKWLALWTLIDIRMQDEQLEKAIELLRQLMDPHQQALPQKGQEKLIGIERAFEQRDKKECSALIIQALDWAKDKKYL
jgi:DNA-binding SARP family transcriptional activator